MSSSFVGYVYCVLLITCAFACEDPPLVGGPRDIDINENEDAKSALSYAVRQHNAMSNDKYWREVSEVFRAQSQVVEGIKYIFTVAMTRTNCTKNSVNEVCAIPQEPKDTQECTFTVWSRPWLNSTIATENCKSEE